MDIWVSVWGLPDIYLAAGDYLVICRFHFCYIIIANLSIQKKNSLFWTVFSHLSKILKNMSDFFKVKYFSRIFTQKVDSRCQKLYRMSIFIIFRTFFHFLKICRKLKCPRKKVFPIFQKWIVSRLFWAKFSEYLVKKSTGCKNLPENGV